MLIPVLDDDKHYWVGEDEVANLLGRGEGWLDSHPAPDLIVRCYLIHRNAAAREALARLAPETREDAVEPGARAWLRRRLIRAARSAIRGHPRLEDDGPIKRESHWRATAREEPWSSEN